MKYTWGHNRRFNAYSNYFLREYGERVQKVTINAGFTCPNRDGTLGQGGCTFCNNEAFNPSYCVKEKAVTQQINEGLEFHETRYRRTSKYLAYFQAYSNTYSSLKEMKEKYEEALFIPKIIGLVIGTRPDCIDDEKLKYIKELSEKYYVIVEYGVESCYNKTLKRINRGHTYEQSMEAIYKTAGYGIKTGAHIIFGLPGETKEDMLKEVSILSELPLKNIKFHQLQIIKNTQMEKEYIENPADFTIFSLEEYLDFFIEFLEQLNPDFIVERFSGEAPPRFLHKSLWGLRNDQILNLFEKKLKEKNTWQGRLFKK